MKGLRKNGWKLILDAVMAIVLALLYNKRVLGMAFHEIAGIAICGLFIIHKLLNRKWIAAVTRSLFSRQTPVRQKLSWVLDFLLLLSFGYVLVSGILISKVVFPASGGNHAFQAGHYAAAALALALTGVHIGLHVSCVSQRMKWLNRLPRLFRRSLAVLLSVAVLVFGGMQLTSTSFLEWIGNIGSIFGATQTVGSIGERSLSAGAPSLENNSAASASTADASGTSNVQADGSETASTVGASQGSSHGMGLMNGQGARGGESGNTSIPGIWLSFTALMFAFAVLSAWLDGGLAAFRRRKRLRSALHAIQTA